MKDENQKMLKREYEKRRDQYINQKLQDLRTLFYANRPSAEDVIRHLDRNVMLHAQHKEKPKAIIH
jgi:hypothetical protein